MPVFDTLRVICWCILHGCSPFKADKNHLHHHFISLGFSHFGVTMAEIALNMAVVAVWALVWQSGASVAVQFYVVLGCAFLVTFGSAGVIKLILRRR